MTNIEELAKQIVHADVNGALVPAPSAPLSLSDAYAVQSACTHYGQAHKDVATNKYKTVGYKIGATSKETQKFLGLDEPFYGPLYLGASAVDDCLDESQINGITFSVYRQHNPRVEAEFVVCLKDDLIRGDRDFQIEDILDHVDWIAPGLEFVGSRFAPSDKPLGTSVIADLGANQFMVVGKPYKAWRELDLTNLPVSLGFTDRLLVMKMWPEPVVHGHSGMSVFGNPLAMVCWLLNHENMRDTGLKAGEWISCGTCTGALAVAEDKNISAADFGVLGKLVGITNDYHNRFPIS